MFQKLDLNLDSLNELQLAAAEKGFDLLRDYAHTKQQAITARKQGDIELARILEENCTRTYWQLPTWARGW